MANGYIAVIDSGIGGLTVLKSLVKEFPNENFIYYGDNKNAPYGNYSAFTVRRLTLKILTELFCYDIKFVVIACNTISLCAADLVRGVYKTFCVYPPAELLETKKEYTALLATLSTCDHYKHYKYIRPFPLKYLAGDIERNIFCLDHIDITSHIKKIPKKYKNVILGCTHYGFVENDISIHLKPPKTLNGTKGLIAAIKKDRKISINSKNISKNQVIFIGENSKYNFEVWKKVVIN